jgi:phosphoenolpyruvate synthase/pyruvate phosphate dikinase
MYSGQEEEISDSTHAQPDFNPLAQLKRDFQGQLRTIVESFRNARQESSKADFRNIFDVLEHVAEDRMAGFFELRGAVEAQCQHYEKLWFPGDHLVSMVTQVKVLLSGRFADSVVETRLEHEFRRVCQMAYETARTDMQKMLDERLTREKQALETEYQTSLAQAMQQSEEQYREKLEEIRKQLEEKSQSLSQTDQLLSEQRKEVVQLREEVAKLKGQLEELRRREREDHDDARSSFSVATNATYATYKSVHPDGRAMSVPDVNKDFNGYWCSGRVALLALVLRHNTSGQTECLQAVQSLCEEEESLLTVQQTLLQCSTISTVFRQSLINLKLEGEQQDSVRWPQNFENLSGLTNEQITALKKKAAKIARLLIVTPGFNVKSSFASKYVSMTIKDRYNKCEKELKQRQIVPTVQFRR